MIETTPLKELCPRCHKQRLNLYRETYLFFGDRKRAWVKCGACGFSENRTFTNSRIRQRSLGER